MSSEKTIHSANIEEVHWMPISELIRPIPPVLTCEKVASIVETLKKDPAQIPPIDVLWVKGTQGGNYFYSFGGCHRYEAHKSAGMSEIRVKLIESTLRDLQTYLGSSCPKELK